MKEFTPIICRKKGSILLISIMGMAIVITLMATIISLTAYYATQSSLIVAQAEYNARLDAVGSIYIYEQQQLYNQSLLQQDGDDESLDFVAGQEFVAQGFTQYFFDTNLFFSSDFFINTNNGVLKVYDRSSSDATDDFYSISNAEVILYVKLTDGELDIYRYRV